MSQAEFDGRSIIRAVEELFSDLFTPRESWAAWLDVVLPVLYGLPIVDSEKLRLFKRATGRTQMFSAPVQEAWFLCGRRSGKSRFLALLAVLIALFRDYAKFTAPGEQPMVMILAADRDQAGVIFGYAQALVERIPMLSEQLECEPRADELQFRNGVAIGVHTSSYKTVRGRTLAAVLCDEAAFWRSDDSRNPAEAVIRALRPALSTIPGSPLLVASSTYTADGILYDAYQKHWGKDTSRVLVWKLDTQSMNPSLRKEVIEEAYATDAKDAAAEYGSQWLTDAPCGPSRGARSPSSWCSTVWRRSSRRSSLTKRVRQFLNDELIDAATMRDRYSLPRAASRRSRRCSDSRTSWGAMVSIP